MTFMSNLREKTDAQNMIDLTKNLHKKWSMTELKKCQQDFT